MKIATKTYASFSAYPLFPIAAAIALILLQTFPSAAAQERGPSLSARDLFLERADPPLGLRWRILLLNPPAGYQPVNAEAVFHTNEHVRFEIESNAAGYLYLLQQGSDLGWDVLFPSVEARDDNNRVEPMSPVQIPRRDDFFFDSNPGREQLYIVLALKPEPDLEHLLNLVRAQRRGTQQRDGTLPSVATAVSKMVRVELLSRNLKISRSADSDSSVNGQNAVYVVNAEPSGERVIAELSLNHER